MTEYYYYGMAATVFIVSCWIFAAVRVWHTCNSPKYHRPYLWPDRKLQILIMLMGTVLLPYAINPTSESAWILMKSYFPTCCYFYCGSLLLCFFGRVNHWDRWMYISWVAAFITMIPMIPLVLNAWIPGDILGPWGVKMTTYLAIVVALVMMAYSALAMRQVVHWMAEIRDENYSNPNDFPMKYAKRVWLAPLFYTPLFWPAFIWDSPTLMAIQNLLMAVANVILLLTALPAWRRNVIIPDADDTPPDSESINDELGTGRVNEIAQKIEIFVSQQQGFLDEHLKIEHVVRACGYNRNYISRVFKDRFGGFYNYVNQLRLQHFEKYAQEHPEMTKDAAARASGFSSYQAYYRAKERLRTT
jgi:AraC-like DNA-binding protein